MEGRADARTDVREKEGELVKLRKENKDMEAQVIAYCHHHTTAAAIAATTYHHHRHRQRHVATTTAITTANLTTSTITRSPPLTRRWSTCSRAGRRRTGCGKRSTGLGLRTSSTSYAP